jgi:Raf kinase inhibitor-like YbhB/YbcL family protein
MRLKVVIYTKIYKRGGYMQFTIESKAFELNPKYSLMKDNINIPITFKDVNKNAKSLAIIFHDITYTWVHWFVVNIPVSITEISEGMSLKNMPKDSIELINDYGNAHYDGPCPPAQDGYHEYVLSVFSLNVENLNLDKLKIYHYISYLEFKELFKENIIEEKSLSCYYRSY